METMQRAQILERIERLHKKTNIAMNAENPMTAKNAKVQRERKN